MKRVYRRLKPPATAARPLGEEGRILAGVRIEPGARLMGVAYERSGAGLALFCEPAGSIKGGQRCALLLSILAAGPALADTTYVIAVSNRVTEVQPSATVELWAVFDEDLYAFAGAAFDFRAVPDVGGFSDPRRRLDGPGTKDGEVAPDGDSATGTLWTSDIEIDAGAYDGLVFANDGDPVIASFRDIWRFNAEDGSVAWHADRLASVSGNCGGAIGNSAFYIADVEVGGEVIKKFDLATGDFLYQSGVMPGFLVQNTPMVGPDGSIYFNRTQNNEAVDFFYAFEDTGSALVEKWNRPAHYSASAEFGIGPDGSVYMAVPGKILARLDPATGDILDQSQPLAGDFFSPRFAIDKQGTVFLSNSSFSDGALYAFAPSLHELWSVPVKNINIGGPALAADGTLIVCGIGADLRAYRSPLVCYPDFTGDGTLDLFDFLAYVNAFNAADPAADCTGDGAFNLFDFLCFVNAFNAGC